MVLLKEDDVKAFFKEYAKRRKIEFKSEVRLGSYTIDFLAKIDNKWSGIDVKGETSNIFTTLGQLVNYTKFISHVYLCGPTSFIEKFKETYFNSPLFTKIEENIGIMAVNENNVKILKTPTCKDYYIKFPKHFIRKNMKYGFPRSDPKLDKIDETILNFLKVKKIATIWDIIQGRGFNSMYKNPYETINKRVKNLVHFGYIEILKKHPKIVSLVNK